MTTTNGCSIRRLMSQSSCRQAGNGWYKARFGFAAKEDVGFYGNEWKLIAELRLTFMDGTEAVIGTDESWTVRRSNILFSNLYDGEIVDDTLEQLPQEQAVLTDAPKGKLTARMSLPVQRFIYRRGKSCSREISTMKTSVRQNPNIFISQMGKRR